MVDGRKPVAHDVIVRCRGVSGSELAGEGGPVQPLGEASVLPGGAQGAQPLGVGSARYVLVTMTRWSGEVWLAEWKMSADQRNWAISGGVGCRLAGADGCLSLSTAERRSTFLRGLKPHIKTQVYLHCRDGEDLETLMSLAEKVDDITCNPAAHRNRPLTSAMRPPSPATSNPVPMRPPSPATQGPEPMELGAMQHAPTDRLAATSVPRPPLTAQQRAALLENGGCFYCRRPHARHFSSDCPARRNRPPTPNFRSGPNPGRRQGKGPPQR